MHMIKSPNINKNTIPPTLTAKMTIPNNINAMIAKIINKNIKSTPFFIKVADIIAC